MNQITEITLRDQVESWRKKAKELERANATLKKSAKKVAHRLVRDCMLHESNTLILTLRAMAE